MKQFLRHIALFGIPFGLLLGYVLFFPPPKEYAYQQIQKDCRAGNWIYQRLFQNDKPIDVAFVGTSRTMCDVRDDLLEQRLSAESGRPIHVANLGVCRTGENLHYLIARELLAQKSPRVIFYEVPAFLKNNSHTHFTDLALASDVLAPPAGLHPEYFPDLQSLVWKRWIHHRESWLGIKRSYEDIIPTRDHSFLVVENDLVADPGDMEHNRKKQQARDSLPPTGFPGSWLYRLDQSSPWAYLRAVQQMAQAKGTRLVFLYLPPYGGPATGPRERAFYRELAPVAVPPDSIFGRDDLHFDPHHLNQAGALQLTDWLSEQVKKQLFP